MVGAALTKPACFRIPENVEFLRWSGDGDWVIYHTGTGETLRVSDLALAILNEVGQHHTVNEHELIESLLTLFDAPPSVQELQSSLKDHLHLLLSHECIETTPCA